MVSLEALFATLAVDAHEGRDIATFDILGAYLHAEMPKGQTILLRLKRIFIDIMCEINPEYVKFIRCEKVQRVLYLRILRVIYSCIESALQWYVLYSKTLKGLGYKLNPYDFCVANKVIDGKQCTVAWYVDDNKDSHIDPKVIDELLKIIQRHFDDIKVMRGKKHKFLGMNIEVTNDRKIKINMRKQLENLKKY